MGTVVFFVFAFLAVAAAYGVVSSNNIVHSALFLALSFFGIAVLYILMNAEFLAAVQILVYAGAVCIMVVFAVMLTLRGDVSESSTGTKKVWGAVVSILVFLMIGLAVLTNLDWRTALSASTGYGSTIDLSLLLLSKYIIPFEAAAFLLTVALIGAVILAKGVEENK